MKKQTIEGFKLLCVLAAFVVLTSVGTKRSFAENIVLDQPLSNATQRKNILPDSSNSTATVTAPDASLPLLDKVAGEALPDEKPLIPQDFSVTKLSNGLTVAIKRDTRFPLVSLRLYVHAGSSYESKAEEGISHVLEHMVFKGTEKFLKGSIASEVESVGGYLNAATSFDHTVYLTDMTSESWKKGLDVLKEMAFKPTLDNDELTSEKDVIVAELKRGEDSPGSRLFRMMQGLVFKGTPYAHPIIGYEKTIRSFTPEQIRDYIEKHYQPQSMTLVIVGNVDMEQALAEATVLFGDIKNTRSVVEDPLRLAKPVQANFATDIQSGPWKKVHLALAFPSPDQNDVRSARLDLLSQLLAGDGTSRFYRTYKYDKRLVDSISVSTYGLEHTGISFIQVTLDPDKVVPFWKTFTRELANLDALQFTAKELERAKLNIEDDLYRSKETISGLTSKIGYFQFFSKGQDAEKNYLNTIQATSADTLVHDAKELFDPSKAALVGLFPEDQDISAYKLPKGSASVASWMEAEFVRVLHPKVYEKNSAIDASSSEREVVELGKGRTVILLPDTTLPYASTTLMYKGGNSLLDTTTQGLGTFTAGLLQKGTRTLDAKAFEEFLSDRAASFGASAGTQSFVLSFNAPSKYFTDLFGLMSTIIKSPGLKKTEATRVIENQLAAITSMQESPTGLAFSRMYELLFPNHPYGYQSLGEVEKVKKFTAEKARGFWKKQTSEPWVLTVCGTFDREEVLRLASTLPTPTLDASAIAVPVWGSQKELNLSLKGRQQAHFLMIFPTVAVGAEDDPAIDLLQNILAGQSGLLFRDLRDKQGLGYTVTALPIRMQKAGALVFYIGTEESKVEQAKAGFEKVISELKVSLLPEEELTRGKNQIKGSYYKERQRLSSRSGEAARLFTLGLPLDFGKDNVAKAQALTPLDIQNVAKKYLTTEKAYIIKVLPQ